MEENPYSEFAYKLYWGHMKENEHTVTVQRFMFTLFLPCFSLMCYKFLLFFCHLLLKPCNVFMCEINSNKLEYIALQIALNLSLKYFDYKFYMFGVELKH